MADFLHNLNSTIRQISAELVPRKVQTLSHVFSSQWMDVQIKASLASLTGVPEFPGSPSSPLIPFSPLSPADPRSPCHALCGTTSVVRTRYVLTHTHIHTLPKVPDKLTLAPGKPSPGSPLGPVTPCDPCSPWIKHIDKLVARSVKDLWDGVYRSMKDNKSQPTFGPWTPSPGGPVGPEGPGRPALPCSVEDTEQ